MQISKNSKREQPDLLVPKLAQDIRLVIDCFRPKLRIGLRFLRILFLTQTDDQITLLSRPFFRINEDLCHYQYKLLTCLEFDEHWDQEENILLSELVR